MRSLGSHFFIAGVRTRLKKYSKPIQMMPKMRCSQRRAIISFASAVSSKAKCGRHAGNESAKRLKIMGTSVVYQIVLRNYRNGLRRNPSIGLQQYVQRVVPERGLETPRPSHH